MNNWVKMSEAKPDKNGEYFCAVEDYTLILFWDRDADRFTTNGCQMCNEVYPNSKIKAYCKIVKPSKETNERVLTCVYCGMEYPQDTPSHGAKILTDHIKVCEKHPMREAEAKIAKLKAALIGLVGTGEKEELLKMEAAIRASIAPDADKTAAINAIHTLFSLLDTEVQGE